jgi:Protein of unknown function (DUF3037)
MTRYLYSLVRCVPDPRTGEFVNVGAIAGDPESEDWSVRQVSNESRVRKLADATALGAVHEFLSRIGFEIDKIQSPTVTDSNEILDEAWLKRLHHDHRSVVQLSPPAPILADDAEQALDVLFSREIIDPVTQPRERAITKHRVIRDLRLAYRRAHIQPNQARRKVDLFVGDHVHTSLDYAIANGVAVQLCQGWSFQGVHLEPVSEQVKAWAYALRQLRDGQESRVMGADNWIKTVDPTVDIDVVVTLPTDVDQRDAYDEALEVFGQLEASVHQLQDVDVVGRKAARLLGIELGQIG